MTLFKMVSYSVAIIQFDLQYDNSNTFVGKYFEHLQINITFI